MQNLKPTHFSVVLDRVVGIAQRLCCPRTRSGLRHNLVARVVAVAQPRDVIEEFLTRDVIELTREIFRLRHMKAGLLRASIGSGVRDVMESLGYDEREGYGSAGKLARVWIAGEKGAQKEVAHALQKAQLAIEDLMAKTLEGEIDSFERFDRILASSEARRNYTLPEIERHRTALGAAVRQAIDEVQDAEFHDVEAGASEEGTPS
jgi:hypothetical protein